MAIVNLGNLNIVTGFPPVAFTAFPYDQNTGVGIGCIFNSTDFGNIFSFVQIRVGISSGALPFFIDSVVYRLDIINVPQYILIPFSPLYFNSGNCTLLAERRPTFRGAGDGTQVSLTLLYDDALTVPTWRG